MSHCSGDQRRAGRNPHRDRNASNRPRPAKALVTAASTSFPPTRLGVMVGVLALLPVVLPVVRRALRASLIALGA